MAQQDASWKTPAKIHATASLNRRQGAGKAFVILSTRRIEQRIGNVSARRRIPTVGSWQFEIAGNLGNKIVEMASGS
jgi:hypothetical protein